MGIKLIYGRAGSGKSEYCFQQMVQNIQEDVKIYMITPEQFSYTAEKKLLDHIHQNAVIKAEILTFKRMAHRVMQKTGGLTKTNLSKTGKAMLIAHILEEQKKNLMFLNRSEQNIEIIEKQIKEFKKHMITLQKLQETMEVISDPYLKIKLQDLFLIYKAYEQHIQEQYIDEEDILTTLVNHLEESKLFKEAIIYIDEFSGFTKQEYEIIRRLLRTAKDVAITICSDDMEISDDFNDIFLENKKTIQKLIKIANEEHIKVNDTIYLDKEQRFKNEELNILEENLAKNTRRSYSKPCQNISLFLAKDPFSEMEEIASKIIHLVKSEHYRYQDISIITKNIEKEAPIIKAVFTRFGIPFFMDQKKDLSENVLVQYLLSILEIFAKNWSYEAMFHYLKTGFVLNTENEEDLYLLENYCIHYGIRGNKWYKEDWKIAESEEILEKLNKLRKSIVEPLMAFKQKLEKGKTAREISKALYEFLVQNEIEKKLERKAQQLEEIGRIELANQYRTSLEIILQVIDEMVLVLEEKKISFAGYEKIWKVGLQNSQMGAIPATCDQVIIGDVERSRSHKVKACFIIRAK